MELLPDIHSLNNKILFHFTASGCYTALCLASLSLSTDLIILKKSPDWIYFLFLFFTSFLYYNFHKISWFGHPRMRSSQNLKYRWPAEFPGLLLLSLIIGFVGSMALVTYSINNLYKLAFGLIAGFIAMNYNLGLFGLRLRSIKGFKAFTIALVSVITSIIIPVANPNTWQQIISLDFIVYAFSQFFFVAALCIAADMRDTEEDREDHIKTFPVVAGIELSKKLILLLLVFEIILLVILFQRSYLEVKQLESMILVSMLSMLVSYQLQSKNSYYYFVLIIDGLIAIQSCSILILQALNNW